jgi:hypothetical protein
MVLPTRRQVVKGLAGAGAAAGLGVLAPGTASASTSTSTAAAPGTADGDTVIERDVCVIGGGSSGTYTAVRLTDLGKSVVVVETTDRLGGHTQTYTDPATGLTADMGVMVFHDSPFTRDYFARFSVPLVKFNFAGPTPVYADFRTGKVVPGYTPPVPTALEKYFELLLKYPSLPDGYYLPDPVPAELLQPWGDYVVANGLESIVPLVAEYGQGFAHLMQLPTVFILKYFGIQTIQELFTGDFLTTANNDNSALYEAATKYLGSNVLLNTNVVAGKRSADGVELLTVGPHGPVTIRAGKIVITAPPQPWTLASFDLDATELNLFSRFRHGNYYTSLVELPGVPETTSVQNIGANTQYNLAPLPSVYFVSPSPVPGVFNAKFGSDVPLPDAAARSMILGSLSRLQRAGTIPKTKPKFADYSAHIPYEMTVSAQDVAAGFYSRLYALQGRRSTFWNGAAFQAHDSALLWQYAETLLPQIAA